MPGFHLPGEAVSQVVALGRGRQAHPFPGTLVLYPSLTQPDDDVHHTLEEFQTSQKLPHVLRQGAFEFQATPGDRVHEAQPAGMQGLPREAAHGLDPRIFHPLQAGGAAAIDRVAHQRMADMRARRSEEEELHLAKLVETGVEVEDILKIRRRLHGTDAETQTE